jgi:cell wall-associated NlpC family hydrolase
MTGDDVAHAALALVGTPFRLHGRDPRHGLDCVGVLAIAICARAALPNSYTLRGGRLEEIERLAPSLGLETAAGRILAGDVLLFRPGPAQFHFAIAANRNLLVHAHAGLRRVVVGPRPEHWPLIGHWRLQNPRN